MSLSLFIARRIYKGEEAGRQMSRPAVLIAMTGIAIGLAVMLLSVSVVVGFKREIRDKIEGFGAQIQVSNLHVASSYEVSPVVVGDTLTALLKNDPAVKHVQRYATKVGMIKTNETFQGMVLKGIGPEYDLRFFRRHLVEGEFPQFSDSASSNRVVISRTLARLLKLKLGDKLDTYYIQEEVRARRLQVVGIYQTNFAEFDRLFLFTDLCLVKRLNQWERDQAGGAEVMLRDGAPLEETTYRLADQLSDTSDRYGQRYCVRNVEQLHPQVFAWLEILDVNIWVILILMVGVAGFTMISGLLILIIERTSMIGVLKSLGADNATVRRLFLWLSVFLIGRGMLWGNLVGLVLIGVQHAFGLFHLDPDTYYMETVPVAFPLFLFLLLNLGTFLVSLLMLIAPSYLISRICPAQSMRYE